MKYTYNTKKGPALIIMSLIIYECGTPINWPPASADTRDLHKVHAINAAEVRENQIPSSGAQR